jgi:hypothetical protein
VLLLEVVKYSTEIQMEAGMSKLLKLFPPKYTVAFGLDPNSPLPLVTKQGTLMCKIIQATRSPGVNRCGLILPDSQKFYLPYTSPKAKLHLPTPWLTAPC